MSPIKCSKHFFFCFKTSKLTKEKRKQRILFPPNRNIWLITLGLKRVSCYWGRSEWSSFLDQNWRFFVKPFFEMGISFFSWHKKILMFHNVLVWYKLYTSIGNRVCEWLLSKRNVHIFNCQEMCFDSFCYPSWLTISSSYKYLSWFLAL